MDDQVASKIDIVHSVLRGKAVIVAFSGGVDSSVMVSLAKDVCRKVLAVTVDSTIIPPEEKENAERVAGELEVEHTVVWFDSLSDPQFVANPANRCYYCKKKLFQNLKKLAEERGYELVVEGSNASDMFVHRPGILALREEGILSPYIIAGITKDEIRIIARDRGLSVSNQPSMACLATRIPYGEVITYEKLRRVAESERYIKQLVGVKVLRVRSHGDLARIEVGKEEREKLFSTEILDKIVEKLKELGFKYCTLDAEGYRTGAMDEVLKGKTTIPTSK
ncbi:MAG: ATP-dependent sacrificial sulfur transferase LarE [Candidatus Jordarchaeaceae archaeon]